MTTTTIVRLVRWYHRDKDAGDPVFIRSQVEIGLVLNNTVSKAKRERS
jgi:hypothetical protein